MVSVRVSGCVRVSTFGNGYRGNEHSNALLVVVVFLVRTQYAVIDPGSGTLNT